MIGLVLAKAETTYGVDPTPTASANTIAVARSSVKYGPKFQHLLRNILDGNHSKVSGFNVLPQVDFSFTVELRGNRTDGTAADISKGASANAIEINPLLLACDLAATYTAETSVGAKNGYVTYKPTTPSDQGASVTFYFYSGGKLHKITGCKGTVKGNLTAGQFGTLEFNFTGLYNSVTDVAISGITPTWLDTKPPTFTAATSTVDAFSPVFQKLDFDLGNKVERREDANSTNGVKGFLITDRDGKATIDPESETEATNPVWGDLYNATARTITAVVGTQTGNRIQITLMGVSEAVSYGDRGGIRTSQISYSLERAALSTTAGNEFQLKFY